MYKLFICIYIYMYFIHFIYIFLFIIICALGRSAFRVTFPLVCELHLRITSHELSRRTPRLFFFFFFFFFFNKQNRPIFPFAIMKQCNERGYQKLAKLREGYDEISRCRN